jgi:hypothetical protein
MPYYVDRDRLGALQVRNSHASRLSNWSAEATTEPPKLVEQVVS